LTEEKGTQNVAEGTDRVTVAIAEGIVYVVAGWEIVID